MVLLTVVFENDEDELINSVNEMQEYFKKKNISIGVNEKIDNNIHFMRVFCDEKEIDENYTNMFNLYISNILYRIVVREYCKDEIQNYLNEMYFFLKYYEMKEVVEKSLKILEQEIGEFDEDTIFCMNRINSIIEKISQFLKENKEINIKGFITFRMKQFKDDLEAVINKVVEKYMVEKEYNEFIKLLKYFVEVQESKIDIINIIVKNDGKYLIQDSEGKDILQNMMEELSDAKYSGSISVEDLIISGLITYCPKNIIIHCEENCLNKEMLNTIKSVFQERVSVCSSCEICEKIKNEIKV